LRQELERHEAAELGVFGLVHHAHAAATELFPNAVVGNGLADHEALASQQNAGVLRNDASIRRVYRQVNAHRNCRAGYLRWRTEELRWRGTDCPPLLKTFAAIDGPALRGLEGDGGFLPTLGTRGGGFGSVPAGVRRRLPALGLAGFAALGFVLETLVRVKDLLAGGKDKIATALDTLQHFVPVFHAQLPCSNGPPLPFGWMGDGAFVRPPPCREQA
jgi:hypothetical protein